MAQESECWVLHVGALYLQQHFDHVDVSVNRTRLESWLKSHPGLKESPVGLSQGEPISTWPPPDAQRSPKQNRAADCFGFVNLVQNPSGVDLVAWSQGRLAAIEAKGVTRGPVARQITAVQKDLDKLGSLSGYSGVTSWILVDARPHEKPLALAAALVRRVLKNDWPGNVKLGLVTASDGLPRSCVTCGYATKSPDFLRVPADESLHPADKHELRRGGSPAGGVDELVAVLDPAVASTRTRRQLAELPRELWPDARAWSGL